MKGTHVPPLPFAGLSIVLGPCVFSQDNGRWSRPIPDCFNVWVALGGHAEVQTMGNIYPIRPATAFVFSPHQRLSARATDRHTFRNFACRFLPTGGGGEDLKKRAATLMGIPSSDFARTRELCRAAVQCTHYNDALAAQ